MPAPTDPNEWFDSARLRAWREEAGLTKEEVCFRNAPLSYPYLSNLEDGRQTPSVNLVYRLATFYGRNPAELFRDPNGAVTEATG